MPIAKGRECQAIPGHGLSSSTRLLLFQQSLTRGLSLPHTPAKVPACRGWGLLLMVVPTLGGPPRLSLGLSSALAPKGWSVLAYAPVLAPAILLGLA